MVFFFVVSGWSGHWFVVILPNIIWQYNHNWPVVYHMQELGKTQLSNLNYFNFFTDLFSLNSALIIIWLIGLGSFDFRQREKRNPVYWSRNYLRFFTLFYYERKSLLYNGTSTFLSCFWWLCN